MKRIGSFLLAVILSSCAQAGAQNNPLSKYLFDQNWTPIPNHESYWVPGIILTVDMSSGQIGYLNPMLSGTQRSLKLDNESGTFDEHRAAFTTNGDGAVSGISQILNGLNIGASFKNNPSVSFSGMAYTGLRLDDWAPITVGTNEVYKNIVDHYGDQRRVLGFSRGVKYAFFLVQEVALGTGTHIVSTTAISGGASFGGAKDAGECKSPDLPASLSTVKQDTPGQQSDQAPAGAKEDKLADAAKKTASDTAPKTSGEAEDKQSKTSADSVSVRFSFCHAGTNEVTFVSSQPLPVAMKLRLIGSYQDNAGNQTAIDIDNADTPLPIGVGNKQVKCAAQKALHSKFPGIYPPCKVSF